MAFETKVFATPASESEVALQNWVYGISFPWTYVDRGISPEDLSPELKDPYL